MVMYTCMISVLPVIECLKHAEVETCSKSTREGAEEGVIIISSNSTSNTYHRIKHYLIK